MGQPGEPNGMAPAGPPPRAILQIILTAEGALTVNYPSTPNGQPDEVMSLYMLERGKMLIEDKIREGAKGAAMIQAANGPLPKLPAFKGYK